MKSKKLRILLIVFLLLSIAGFKNDLHKNQTGNNYLIAFFKLNEKGGPRGIYVMKIEKDTTVFLIDSSRYGRLKPDDLKFIDSNTIVYNGTKVYDLKSRSIRILKTKAEQFFSLVLDNHNYIVADSSDVDYTLFGYSLSGFEKSFSVQIKKDTFTIHRYAGIPETIRYIYYPEYDPQNVSARNWKITLKILDLNKRITQKIETLYCSDDGFRDNPPERYFNPRYVRNDEKGKITYLKLFESKKNPDNRVIRIYSWDFIHQKKKLIRDVETKHIWSDNIRHRIMRNDLYIGYDDGINKIDKKGRLTQVYFKKGLDLLDFYVY